MNRQEQLAFDQQAALVAGVDEVGRGPLAGPVVAAAVILDPAHPIAGLADSKRLTAAARQRLAREIRCHALSFALAAVGQAEIDRINILQASLLAMRLAVLRLDVRPEHVIVDGNRLPSFEGSGARYSVEARVKGDQTVPSISAASIIAKVCRDRLMRRWDRQYPGYGFASNMGYPTQAHRDGLASLGPCPIHRLSFAPVRECVEGV